MYAKKSDDILEKHFSSEIAHKIPWDVAPGDLAMTFHPFSGDHVLVVTDVGYSDNYKWWIITGLNGDEYWKMKFDISIRGAERRKFRRVSVMDDKARNSHHCYDWLFVRSGHVS
jgi:hypothetical protein